MLGPLFVRAIHGPSSPFPASFDALRTNLTIVVPLLRGTIGGADILNKL